jgi:DNA-binding NarL/FixJ family response regulator
MTTRILLVDDDPTILEAFPVYFSTTKDIEVTGTATTGQIALQWLNSETCDLVLSDIHMPDLDGIELLRAIKQCEYSLPFIAMTAFDTDDTMLKCLSLGASGYILKCQPPAQVIDAVRTVITEGTALSPACTSRLIAQSILEKDETKNSPLLTPEQQHIIALIQQGKTNRQIAQKTNYAEITIKKKISRMLKHYGYQSRAELASNLPPYLKNIPTDHSP